MSDTEELTNIEENADLLIRSGLKAIGDALGPVGMIRFIQQFGNGSGDFTREKYEYLDKRSFEEIYEHVLAMREKRKAEAL